MESIVKIVGSLNSILWGVPMIVFLVGSHIYLTFKTKFVQKHIFKGIKLSLSKAKDDNGEVSVFGALTTALASTIGTGNIIGVGTAIVAGGPGAVFWTWVTGVLAIATKYCESFIAIKHRVKNEDGSYTGGAMTALDHLGMPKLAKVFALLCAVAGFGIGSGVQSNAISSIVYTNYQIPKWIIGLVLAVLTALVILGGLKSIAKVCENLVPFMSIAYTLGCVVILVINRAYIGSALSLIISSAFTTKAAVGGFIGSSMMIAARFGIARGLFSNEAGMGSAPIASSASVAKNAVKPALIGATGVFWDTVVVCLMSGLVMVSTTLKLNGAIDVATLDGATYVNAVFSTLGGAGTLLLVFGVFTFAFSTILGWNYYGERSIAYMFGNKFVKPYKYAWILVVFLGTTLSLGLVWDIADILNGLMIIPNMIAVFILRKEIIDDTNYYLEENHLEEKDESLA